MEPNGQEHHQVSLSSQVQELDLLLTSNRWGQTTRERLSYYALLDQLPRSTETSLATSDSTMGEWDRFPEGSTSSIRARIGQLKSLDAVARCPVLGITGLLNSGKSSLLACYLSDQGRARVLIGQANDQGTHRFVLWMPEAWRRDSQTWAVVLEQIRHVFGSEIEELSERPELAFQQYNGQVLAIEARPTGSEPLHSDESGPKAQDPLLIPLIATDPGLDRWQVALMDCPDIQTGLWLSSPFHEHGNDPSSLSSDRLTTVEHSVSMARHRSEALFRAMRLCSAFVVVTQASSLHDAFVDGLLRGMQSRMPGIDRILAVNRVPRRYFPEQIAEELSELKQRYQLISCYMAYHFEGPLLRERLPKPPSGFAMDEQDPLPLFFKIDHAAGLNQAKELVELEFLLSIGQHMDQGKLIGAARTSLSQQLRQLVDGGWQRITEEQVFRSKRRRRFWQVIAEACFEFSSEGTPEEPLLRLYASREILQQLARSLEKTAPWWAYPSRMVVRIAQVTKEAVGKATTSVLPSRWLSGKSQEMVELVQSGMRRGDIGKVVSAKALATKLQSCDSQADLLHASVAEEWLVGRCQRLIDRFQVESKARLDENQLDRYTQQVWDTMGWKQRLWTGLAPATIAFAPILAVIALPFDFGGSSVLVLASIKELLFAGAAGVGLALIGRDAMPKVAEQQVAWQQLGDLFAIGCDELGLKRPSEVEHPGVLVGGRNKKLACSEVLTPTTLESSVFPQPVDLNEESWTECQNLLRQLTKRAAE